MESCAPSKMKQSTRSTSYSALKWSNPEDGSTQRLFFSRSNFNAIRPLTAAGPGEVATSGMPQHSSFASNYGVEYEDLLAEMLPQYTATDMGKYTGVRAAREYTAGRSHGRMILPLLLGKRRSSRNTVHLNPNRLQRRQRRASGAEVTANPRRVI